MLDLSAIPILDHHCHALLRHQKPFTAVEFQRFFTESTDPTVHAIHVPHTIFFRWATKELATFLGCEPTPTARKAQGARRTRGPGLYQRAKIFRRLRHNIA